MIVETPQCAEGTWLLEASRDDRLRVMTARGVVCPSDQVVVANPTSRTICLYKGMTLGQIDSVLDSSIVSAAAPGPTDVGGPLQAGL